MCDVCTDNRFEIIAKAKKRYLIPLTLIQAPMKWLALTVFCSDVGRWVGLMNTRSKSMSDYIHKAQAVAQTIAEIESLGLEVGRELEQRIKNDYISQPTADVVEVVRCKDCEFWDKDETVLNGGICGEWSDFEDSIISYTKPDDYCSYGERKEI